MQTLNAIAGGIDTSDPVALSSCAVNAELDKLETQLNGIFNDKSRDVGEKIRFLNKLKPEIERAAGDTIGLLETNVSVQRRDYDATISEPAAMPPHIAVMLADSLKNAGPAERVAMCSADARYHDLLNDLGSHYFGLNDKSFTGLVRLSANAKFTGEQQEANKILKADEAQVQHLKTRRSDLANQLDSFIEHNHASVQGQQRDESAHLYKLQGL